MNKIIRISIVCGLFCLGVLLEASHPGPYTKKFNEQKAELIISNQLIGESAEQALKLLGEPSNVVHKESGDLYVEYRPYSFLPFSRFQVKIVEGKVEKIRKYIF